MEARWWPLVSDVPGDRLDRGRMPRMRNSFLLEPPPSPLPSGRAFLRQARFRLHDDYLVKITRAIDEVTDEQIWWRPNEDSNSIGNLILHLCGNARQWIVAGVGGAVDTRERAREFGARGGVDRLTLVNQLEETVREVDARLSDLDRSWSRMPLTRRSSAGACRKDLIRPSSTPSSTSSNISATTPARSSCWRSGMPVNVFACTTIGD